MDVNKGSVKMTVCFYVHVHWRGRLRNLLGVLLRSVVTALIALGKKLHLSRSVVAV